MKKVIILFLLMCPVMAAAQEKVMRKNISADSLNRDDQAPDCILPMEEPPEPLTPIQPIYPTKAMLSKLEGRVIVKVLIDKYGKPLKGKVLKNFGTNVFDKAAIQAVTSVQYKPAMMEGKPINVWMAIPLSFKLNKMEDEPKKETKP
jgi:TonB family protein